MAPAVISPYVIQRIGFTGARQLMLTGRRFGAAAALQYGLIHEVAPVGQLDAQVAATVADILKCAPNALRECKRLLFAVLAQPDSLEERVATFERLRTSEEAAEGILAFIQKKPAPWVPDA
jgi:enoyl-CoA hydratase/carnithine racemase